MNKRRMISLLCAAALTAAGCSASGNSSSGTPEESSKAAAASSSAPAQDSRQEELKELTQKIEQMSRRIDELEEKVTTFSYDRHEIYDDTAVIDAYKKADSSSLTDEKDRYIYEQLTAAVKSVIKDGMTDYEKEKAVYDYIFAAANYNYKNLNPVVDDTVEDNSHTPYGFFHDHSVICVGYATTFKLFMDALGIECMIIHSTKQGEHAWNVVKIDNEWYHVDVFFDGGTHTPIYGAFNVTDSIKQQQGYPWNTGTQPEYPECTSLRCNPVVKGSKECKSVYDLPEHLAEIAGEGSTGVIFLRFPVPEDAGVYGYTQQIEGILSNITFDSKQISFKCFGDAESSSVYASVSAELPDDMTDPGEDDDSIPDDEDYRQAGIDYDRLAQELEKEFGSDVSFYFDEYMNDDSSFNN